MKFTAIILAGGKSSRMGEDKGIMFLEGKPMVQHIIEVVKPLTEKIIIISNNNKYSQFGYPVFEDITKGKGPLAGILTGLQYSTTDKNLILSCDVPFVNKKLLDLLITNSENSDVVIPEKEDRTHQLIGIYDKSCIPTFKRELANNRLKMKLAIKKLNYKIIDANQIDAQVFYNINTKEDAKT
ncbi:MAG: molybdenum cofactor guanylyltransferase [Vicingaceae bacterium]